MKKIFTLIAAAMMAVSTNAQKLSVSAGWNTTIKDVVLIGDMVFNYKNAYATVYMDISEVDLSTYPSFEIVVSADTPVDKLQLYIKSNDGTTDKENWSGVFTAGTTTLSFVPDGAKKITAIGLQAANSENLGNVEIVSASLIDAQNNKTALSYKMPESWAADVVTPITQATISFTEGGQWNFASLKGAEGIALPKTIVINADVFPASVQLKVVTSSDKELYYPLQEGEKTFSTNLIADSEGQTIKSIDIQNTVAQSPFEIKNFTAEIKDYIPTYINNIESATLQNNIRYNLAGQKVNEGYKGVVIMNGKKVVMK